MPQITDPRSVDYTQGGSYQDSGIPLWLRPVTDWWDEQQRKLREWQAQQAAQAQIVNTYSGQIRPQTLQSTPMISPETKQRALQYVQQNPDTPLSQAYWESIANQSEPTKWGFGTPAGINPFGQGGPLYEPPQQLYAGTDPWQGFMQNVLPPVSMYGAGGEFISAAGSAAALAQKSKLAATFINLSGAQPGYVGIPPQDYIGKIISMGPKIGQQITRTAEQVAARLTKTENPVLEVVKLLNEEVPRQTIFEGLTVKAKTARKFTDEAAEDLLKTAEDHLAQIKGVPKPPVSPIAEMPPVTEGATTLYRGGGEGVMPKGKTAQDIIDYETRELGNQIKVEPGINPKEIKSENLQWLTKTQKEARQYGAVTKVPGEDYRVVATDNYGGVLIESQKPISGTAKAEVVPPAVAKAPEAAVGGQKPPVEPPPAPGPAPAGPPPEGPRPPVTMAEDPIRWFGDMLVSPKTEKIRDVSLELRKRAFASKISAFQNRTEQLILDGQSIEDAIKQATTETMSGKMPDVTNTVFDDVTREMSDALFAKMYKVLENDPVELLSTTEALTNALLGKSIPRIPGIKGGSAYTRLLKVFGDNPAIMEALDKPKSLKAVIEDLFYGAQTPKDIDQQVADYLRNLPNRPYQQGETWLSGQAAMDMGDVPYKPPVEPGLLKESQPWDIPGIEPDPRTKDQRILDFLFETKKETPLLGEAPLLDVPPEPQDWLTKISKWAGVGPVAKIVQKEVPGMPTASQNMLVQALKWTGIRIGDIGNMLRAGKASGDFSFWRQSAPFIIANPKKFYNANIKAFKGLYDNAVNKASHDRITQSPLYGLYKEWKLADFLRPTEWTKNVPKGGGVEEFGHIGPGATRFIPRLTENAPWIKLTQRSFVTGLNELMWPILEDAYESSLKHAQEIASGARKLKPGEIINIKKDLQDVSRVLANFSGRGSLGKAQGVAEFLSGALFAPRMVAGRILTARDLFDPRMSPMARKLAWKNFGSFVGGISSVLILGKMVGWWDVVADPRDSDFAKIRIGNTRYDPWGGYQQYVTFAARLLTGTGVSSVTGETNPIDPTTAFARLAESKSAPMLGLFTEFYTGKTFLGEKVDYTNLKQWADRLGVPMAWMQIREAFADNFGQGVASIIPSMVGVGVQTYASPTSPSVIKQQVLDSVGISIPAAEKKPTGLETFQNQLTPAEYDTALQYYGVTYKERVAEFTNSGAEIDNVWTPYTKMTDADKKKQLDSISTDVQEDMVLKYTKNPTPAQKTRVIRKAAQKVLDADYNSIPRRVWEPLEKVWPGIRQTSDYYTKLDEGGTPAEKKLAAQWFQGTEYGKAALRARRDIANAKLNVRRQYPEVGAAYDLIYGR